MEIAKAEAYIDGNGKITADSYFDILEEEGIILDKEKDVVDNGDGTYEVTTEPGYVFEVTIPEDGDIEIDYIGKGENIGPRIREIRISNKTTNSVTVEVDARNAEEAEYTYSYQKVGETEWKDAGTSKNNTCTIENLESNESYTIKVRVETKNGTDEDEISTTIGELPEGTITYGEVEWIGDGTASVKIETSEEGYQLQYQKNSIEGEWTTIGSGEKITGLEHNDTVYGRLFDGVNGTKDEASISIQDKVDPIVTVSPEGTTTNSITVSVSAVDNESGMIGTPTYNYYIKKTSEDDSSYVLKGNTLTETSYTFSGLQQERSYDVKVEVTGDKAGRTGTGILANQTTTKVGGAEGGLTTGAIVASSPTWASGEASITLTTDTGMQIQYQINGIDEGSWATVSTGAKVSGLHHNDTVYARLYDGTNVGDYGSVSIIDNIPPTVSISTSNLTYNSVTLKVTASDGESGLATSGTYTYYLNNTQKASNTTNSYNYTGLIANTQYTLKVIVTDKAGKTTEKSATITTLDQPGLDGVLPVEPELTAGMTPVKWNGSNWIKTTKNDSEWYDYANKEWANVVLGDATFSGNTLDESKPYSMLVWIPRYAYKITSGWHSSTTGTVDVIFIDENNESKSGTTYNGTYDGNTGTYSDYVVHPAFNYGNSNENKLRGLWVGKYETSNIDCTTNELSGRYNGTDKTIQIKAGVTSWRYIEVNNIYTVCTEMNKSGNPYGLSTSDSVVDPHMMKNTEWGVVAYLSKSKYGKETEEVWINPNMYNITGQAGNRVSEDFTSSTNNYKSTNGQKASTTGNTTGVYDMSGGAIEVVAAYVNNGNSNLTTYGSNLINAEAKYKDVYSKGISDNDSNNYVAANSKYGDAVYETSNSGNGYTSWYFDTSYFPNGNAPFLARGGGYNQTSIAGVFNFLSGTSSYSSSSFRLVVPIL